MIEPGSSQQSLQRIEELLDEFQSHPDPVLREKVADLVAGILELHGEALRRLFHSLEGGERAEELAQALMADPYIAAMLQIHGLGQAGGDAELRGRVEAALDEVRPYMQSHGGEVELLEVRSGVARLSLVGACRGCASSLMTLRMGIERELKEHVPELQGIEVEGMPEPGQGHPPPTVVRAPRGYSMAAPKTKASMNFVSLDEFEASQLEQERRWFKLGPVGDFRPGERMVTEIEGVSVMLVSVQGRVFAFENFCPVGEESLEEAEVEGLILVCPKHGYHFSLITGQAREDAEAKLHRLSVSVRDEVIQVAA